MGTLENYLSLPDNKLKDQHQAVIDKIQSQIETDNSRAHITEIQEFNEILAYRYGTVGILFLQNQQGKFQESLKDALVPVINKSADYFQLCEKQKRMDTEAKVSKDAQRTYELQAKRDPLSFFAKGSRGLKVHQLNSVFHSTAA